MNKREVFYKVKAHLLKQQARAVRNARCVYRGDCGMKCAVGALINDEHYSPELEGLTVPNPKIRAALEASGVPTTRDVLDLLERLQDLHDGHLVGSWPAELDYIEKQEFRK